MQKNVSETVQRYPKPALTSPGPKFSRYNIGLAYDFISNITGGKKPDTDMLTGYKVREVIEAVVISDKDKIGLNCPFNIFKKVLYKVNYCKYY